MFQDVFWEVVREVFQEVFGRHFGRLQKPLAKVVDLVSLGILVGPEAPDPDLVFQ